MTEYIKREDAIKAVCDCVPHSCDIVTCEHGCAEASALSKLPAEDVRPLVRGAWRKAHNPSFSPFDNSGAYIFFCSVCGKSRGHAYRFCPYCGADMRGGQAGE